jgi:PEP-CTERM motif
MRLPSPRTMSKAKQTTLIAFLFVIACAFHLRAFADTYQFFTLEPTNEGTLYGLDSAGSTVIFLFNSSKCNNNLLNPCYGVYVDGFFSYTTDTPPALDYDGGVSCATPAGFKALPIGINPIGTAVCNSGRVVFGARSNPNGDPDGLYAGPYSDPQFIDPGPIPNTPFLFLNSAGDFAFTDGSVEEIFFALDLTTHQTPEPTSLVLLGSGILGLVGVARRRSFFHS